MKTKLKPYNHSLYSPHSWPPQVGQLVILLDDPRGYVGILLSITGDRTEVKLLDAQDEVFETNLSALLPTGKTPQDLVLQYEPTALSLSQNLAIERSIPDFTRLRKSTKKGGTRKKKVLTEANKMFLAKLIKEELKQKETKK